MDDKTLFTAGNDGLVPQGDAARQAVDSLRGYVYQVMAAALAWLDLDGQGRLFLEVAEDYAVVARNALEAVQVKDTEATGTITLNTRSVQDAVSNFVSLMTSNPSTDVQLRYFTTSAIGTEKSLDERPGGIAGLEYWRKAAVGADVRPLRAMLESDTFSAVVQEFAKNRDDDALRKDMLRKIHWDCGKPDVGGLRNEFEARLVVIARDVFRLPAPEAMRIAETLIYRVLEKSIAKNPADRVLTRADLYRIVDELTLTPVPRTTIDAMASVFSHLTPSTLANLGTALPVVIAEPSWLINGDALKPSERMVARTTVETNIIDRIRRFGASVVVGATGLGKSWVARTVARNFGREFVVVDFRNADAKETRGRLDAMISRIGGLDPRTFIFEDLNHFNDPSIASSVARVFDALCRRDRAAIITCYLLPTTRALLDVGLDTGCAIACPYFTEEEATALVALHGGDATPWGRLAYIAGAFGHPQLVHAFIAGMSARGWPLSEIRDVVDRGLSSGDIEAEREAARRALISLLPENVRNLLYRLSLTIGRFDRAMALAIANAPPSIAQAGECMDALIGPWLETEGRDRYRVSPLAARSGQGMMSLAEQAGIHGVIATQFMASGTVNAGDADAIMMHAMLGKNERVLASLARSILRSDQHTVGRLVENFTTFKLLRTDAPLYPDNPFVSGMLRLAQFKILVSAGEPDKIAECTSALFSEIEQQPDDKIRHAFRTMCFATVLGTMGIVNYLDDWLDLLQQFQTMTEADRFLRGLQDYFEKRSQGSPGLLGSLFGIGSAGISTVARLESVINQLDGIESARRSLYLSAIGKFVPDYSVFVHGAWTSEDNRDAVNALDAAERYHRMAIKTASWGIRPLTVQCWIAQAVMLDEYAKDREGALKVLNEAIEVLGDDVLLSRARAKIYWRAQDHERALSILREIADEIGRNNSIERAFALRDAAISAAKCNEWAQAEMWFLDSKAAAAQSKLPDMTVMAVGLEADAAVAALQIGETGRALSGLSDALTILASIDPSSSLRAMYCHHVVRHTVLWAQTRIDKRNVKIDGAPIEIEPGCCSNPEPPKAIAERPLGAFDIASYMLAKAEVTSGKNIGIADALYSRLADGPIPVMEIDLRMTRVNRDIKNLNATEFARHLWSYIEAFAYLSQQKQQIMATFDARKPARGDIPTVPRSNVSVPLISNIANDAVFAYAITAACKHSAEALWNLEEALKAEFGCDIPAGALVARANATTQLAAASSFDEALIDAVTWFRSDTHSTPTAYCSAAIRFFQQAGRSNFKSYLIPIIAAWQRNAWTRIVVSETFRLVRPVETVPTVEAALCMPDDDERFLGAIFLAIAIAVGMTLPKEMQGEFEILAAKPAIE